MVVPPAPCGGRDIEKDRGTTAIHPVPETWDMLKGFPARDVQLCVAGTDVQKGEALCTGRRQGDG